MPAGTGKHCAIQSPTTRDDALTTELAITELDASFFQGRFGRMTPAEKRYLRAMTQLEPGAWRSGDIAHILNKEVQSARPSRATLIGKGMTYRLSDSDNSFTVPLSDG